MCGNELLSIDFSDWNYNFQLAHFNYILGFLYSVDHHLHHFIPFSSRLEKAEGSIVQRSFRVPHLGLAPAHYLAPDLQCFSPCLLYIQRIISSCKLQPTSILFQIADRTRRALTRCLRTTSSNI
jgi:hypothetical protein